MKVIFCALIVLLNMWISGCTMVSVPVRVEVEANQRLNTNINHDSLPVRLKLFQLNDKTAFQEATFRQLWKEDKVILGDSLLAKKVFTLSPGSKMRISLTRAANAQYLGVVAIFRRPNLEYWRDLKPLPNPAISMLKPLHIVLSNNKVAFQ